MTTHEQITADVAKEIRERLDAARSRLFALVARTTQELTTLEQHAAGSLVEDAPAETAGAILARLEGSERHELDEIDAAQARLAAGTFGACESCHQPIPLARLRARPTVRYCVACQTSVER
jgi:DnaK suppressor protein